MSLYPLHESIYLIISGRSIIDVLEIPASETRPGDFAIAFRDEHHPNAIVAIVLGTDRYRFRAAGEIVSQKID